MRHAVEEREKRLQSLVTVDELRILPDDPSAQNRAAALRLLDQTGQDVSRELPNHLHSANPKVSEAALSGFMAKGEEPEKPESSGGLDLRESNRFNTQPLYDLLQGPVAERQK